MARAIRNAKIARVELGDGDHGLPTAWLRLDMDGSGQGFGGYHLGGAAMSIFVSGVLSALDVSDWSKLVGTYCRIDHDWNKVYRVGHIVKDTWFDPEEAFAHLQKDNS